MKNKLIIFLISLILIIGFFSFGLADEINLGDSGVYDFIYYNWFSGLGYFNNSVSQWLVGGTATTTLDSILEVQGGFTADNATSTNLYSTNANFDNLLFGNATSSHFAADEFCLNNDCITSWPSGGGNPFNQWLDTTNTPTFVGLNATTTNSDNLLVFNNATVTNHFEADSILYAKDGRVGIGVDPSVLYTEFGAPFVFTTYSQFDAITGFVIGNFNIGSFSPTGDSTAANFGIYNTYSTTGEYNHAFLAGSQNTVSHNGSGRLTTMIAFLNQYQYQLHKLNQ